MKKLLTGILAVLTCFTCATAVACGTTDNPSTSDSGNGGVTSNLEAAKDYLYGMYINQDVEVRKDYEVVNTVFYDGVSYSITWTVSGADSISVKPGSSDVMSLIDVDETKTEQVNYTLTATISDASGKTVTVSFERSVVALEGDSIMAPEENVAYNMYIEQMTLKENLLLTGNMNGNFYEMTTDNAQAANVYAEIVDGGYKFYLLGENDAKSYLALEEYQKSNGYYGAKVSFAAEGSVFYFDANGVWACDLENDSFFLGTYGSYNTASASASNYNKPENIGTSQYPLLIALPGAIQGGMHEGAPVVTEPAADSTLTISEAMALANELKRDTQNKYYVSGTISSITNETYGNMYINDGNGNEILVYGTYDATGANRFDAMENKPQVGDTVKLYTIVSYHSDAPQLKNAWIVEVNGNGGNSGEVTPPAGEDPVVPPVTEGPVTAPVADTAYNMYIEQNGVSKTLYLTGNMSGNFYEMTTDVSKAVDVYAEVVDGGYKFYFLGANSVKSYLALEEYQKSNGYYGAKVSFAAEGSVFQYNELGCWTVTLTNDTYFLGTYGTYETTSASASSFMKDFGTAQFPLTICVATENEGGEVTPPAGEDPVTPPADSNSVSVSIADVASANSWANGTGYASFTQNGVSFSTTGTPVGDWGLNTGKFYTKNNSWRIYQNENGTLTITAAEGKTIAYVKITYEGANNGVILYNGAQVASGEAITVNANSVTIGVAQSTATDKANGNIQITSIEIVYAE